MALALFLLALVALGALALLADAAFLLLARKALQRFALEAIAFVHAARWQVAAGQAGARFLASLRFILCRQFLLPARFALALFGLSPRRLVDRVTSVDPVIHPFIAIATRCLLAQPALLGSATVVGLLAHHPFPRRIATPDLFLLLLALQIKAAFGPLALDALLFVAALLQLPLLHLLALQVLPGFGLLPLAALLVVAALFELPLLHLFALRLLALCILPGLGLLPLRALLVVALLVLLLLTLHVLPRFALLPVQALPGLLAYILAFARVVMRTRGRCRTERQGDRNRGNPRVIPGGQHVGIRFVHADAYRPET